ncbi:hypothetical protein [Thermodesulfatator atlanticus]|uniref:hypothetical protein n=1 Tax=Thermodesulfatator atlanticus TaxID=501497 RepID=UPI0003B4D3F7|nr:hypothetical protein [Thermodesulfatator atlanticus]
MKYCAKENKDRQIYVYPKENLPKSDIIILGTIHRVKKGPELLKEVLFCLKPKIITVEISPYSLAKRRQNEKRWLKTFDKLILQEKIPLNDALASLRETLRMPYEFQVAKSLKLAPAVPIDLNRPAQKYLRELEESLSPDNLRKLSLLDVSFSRELTLAKLFLAGLYEPEKTEEDIVRERHLAFKIKKLAKQKRPLVHIGGWRHLPALLGLIPEAKGILLDPSLRSGD